MSILSDGREAIWGNEGTSSLEAEVLLDGDLVGFIPEIPGSTAFDEAQIVDAIARADYDEPVGRELPEAPPPSRPLMREGGLFRRFRERLPLRLRVGDPGADSALPTRRTDRPWSGAAPRAERYTEFHVKNPARVRPVCPTDHRYTFGR